MSLLIDPYDAQGEEDYHIPGAPGSGFATLCGWCDVNYSESDHPVNCSGCLEILDYCRKLRVTREATKGTK
jgi:hypothetical protein